MLKSLIINNLAALILFSSVLTAYAAEPVKTSSKGPIRIESDYMKYDGTEKISKFTGNVVAYDNEMRMTAQAMDVIFDDKNEIKEIYSQGNVKIEKEGLLTLSDKARFYNDEKKAVLTSNVRVWQGDNYLEGDRVTLYNENNRIFVDRGTNKRVKIIIVPKEEKK